jgi:hypothetical protein
MEKLVDRIRQIYRAGKEKLASEVDGVREIYRAEKVKLLGNIPVQDLYGDLRMASSCDCNCRCD